MATTAELLPAMSCRRRAAKVAMDTWSSWLAEVGRLSTEAGWARVLFSEARAAEVTWAIMKPELSPPSLTRNAGRPDSAGSTSWAMRRSDRAPISAMARASTSAAMATGSAWKLPPESTSPSALNTSGLSDTALASRRNTPAAKRRWSRQAPITWGWQRSE